jgi:hypothetical protein
VIGRAPDAGGRHYAGDATQAQVLVGLEQSLQSAQATAASPRAADDDDDDESTGTQVWCLLLNCMATRFTRTLHCHPRSSWRPGVVRSLMAEDGPPAPWPPLLRDRINQALGTRWSRQHHRKTCRPRRHRQTNRSSLPVPTPLVRHLGPFLSPLWHRWTLRGGC